MQPTREQFEEALFGPWTYSDRNHPLGLDPEAIQAGAFTSDDPRQMARKGGRSVFGATWLALQAIPFYPERRRNVVWAAWTQPLSSPALKLPPASGILQTETNDELRARGIEAVYESKRVNGAQFVIDDGYAVA